MSIDSHRVRPQLNTFACIFFGVISKCQLGVIPDSMKLVFLILNSLPSMTFLVKFEEFRMTYPIVTWKYKEYSKLNEEFFYENMNGISLSWKEKEKKNK